MQSSGGKLTPYTEGSVRELLAISFPLILSMLSTNVMAFVDRLILAQYDITAMNAAVVAGYFASIFQYGAMGIVSISEIFVGQYNGSNKHQKIGEPVWQMIWFSFFTFFLFIPMGLSGSYFIVPEYAVSGIPFYQWHMFFGPFFALSTTLSSFFIGRGSVKFVMFATILSNIINIALDFVFIFGLKNILNPMGAEGAAIATGIAEALQALILFSVFLNKSHRKTYGTGKWIFKAKLFWQSIHLGVPNCLSSVIEMFAWAVLTNILASASEFHITVYSIGDSFFSLFAFGFIGLQMGITSVAANYIGANREEILKKSLWSGIKIIFVIMLIMIIPLCFFSDKLTEAFLSGTDPLFNEEIKTYVLVAARWLWLYFIFDGISRLITGVLTAAGDTLFIMFMNGISAWAFSVLPTYLALHYLKSSPITSWILFAGYGFLNAYSFYIRYKRKRSFTSSALHAVT